MSVFDVSEKNGYLPNVPALRHLPERYQAMENIMQELPTILRNYDDKTHLKELVEALPQYEDKIAAETDPNLLQSLWRDFGILAAAYIVEGKEKEGQMRVRVPRQISLPFGKLAEILDEKLIMSYDSYCLNNHYSVDGNSSWDHLRLIRTFNAAPEEATFILIHAEIESNTPSLIASYNILKKAIEDNDVELAKKGLEKLRETQEKMIAAGMKMFNASAPEGYLSKVRPWIFGYKNNPDFPNGVVFEGVLNEEPQYLRGETGAQSTIVPSLDAVLGITHKEDALKVMLTELEEYRPAPQRAYLRELREYFYTTADDGTQTHRLRALCETDVEAARMFNACVLNVFNFRSMHVVYSDVYVSRFTEREAATGGTPFKTYLRKHRDESFRQQISKFPEAILQHNEISDREEFMRDINAVGEAENGIPKFLQTQFAEIIEKHGNGHKSYTQKMYPSQQDWDDMLERERAAEAK